MVWQGKKLRLCNTFSFQAPEDVLYYVLFGFEQLDLSPENVSLNLAGAAAERGDIFDLLYRYVREVTYYDKGPRPIQELAPYQELPLQCISQ